MEKLMPKRIDDILPASKPAPDKMDVLIHDESSCYATVHGRRKSDIFKPIDDPKFGVMRKLFERLACYLRKLSD